MCNVLLLACYRTYNPYIQHFILAVTKHLPGRPGSSSSSSTTGGGESATSDANAMETDALLQSTDAQQPSAHSNESEVNKHQLLLLKQSTLRYVICMLIGLLNPV